MVVASEWNWGNVDVNREQGCPPKGKVRQDRRY